MIKVVESFITSKDIILECTLKLKKYKIDVTEYRNILLFNV